MIEKLLKTLLNNKDNQIYNYTVPDLWNCFDYDKSKFIKTPTNELIVNPYDFYSAVIKDYILPNKLKDVNYQDSLSKQSHKLHPENYRGGDWIKESVVYSTMIRTSSAWDSDRSGYLEDSNIYHMRETGSFVKMLSLLPLLKKMGITVVYLLPISKFSLENKKGDLGSPYGVSNFTELDPNLKDTLTKDNMTLDEEFRAFVEACHILDMRVMIDIIPRTNAVSNDLIKDYPEWFYWIKASEYDQYLVPRIKNINNTAVPTVDLMEEVYKEKDTLRHINMFQYDPKTQNQKLWNEIKDSKNLSKEIRKNFDLTIAPAFSDHINDPQPPWTDATFFRMYLDIPQETINFVDKIDRPPYILFDTIKSNMYHGKIPNIKLWEKLSDIVPSYQKRFGIDGARIDMGHALPAKLLSMIINKARLNDRDFSFIAEELQPSNAQFAYDAGYNMIISNGFIMEPRVFEGALYEFMYNSVKLPLPVFACGETHDTPRLASRNGNEQLAKLLIVLNMFMPNGVPFINSGQEVYEKQPMNTGLDCFNNEVYSLDRRDPYNGKLALFDKYQFHYTTKRRWELPDILDFIKPIRKRWLKQLTNKNSFVPIYSADHSKTFIGLAYYKETATNKNNCLMILANGDPFNQQLLSPDIKQLRTISNNQEMLGKLVFSTHEDPRKFTQFHNINTIDLHLGAGEIKIVEL